MARAKERDCLDPWGEPEGDRRRISLKCRQLGWGPRGRAVRGIGQDQRLSREAQWEWRARGWGEGGQVGQASRGSTRWAGRSRRRPCFIGGLRKGWRRAYLLHFGAPLLQPAYKYGKGREPREKSRDDTHPGTGDSGPS